MEVLSLMVVVDDSVCGEWDNKYLRAWFWIAAENPEESASTPLHYRAAGNTEAWYM